MIDDEHGAVCPCCMCVHVRQAPKRQASVDDLVAALQSIAVTAGLVYLLLCEVPGLIRALM